MQDEEVWGRHQNGDDGPPQPGRGIWYRRKPLVTQPSEAIAFAETLACRLHSVSKAERE